MELLTAKQASDLANKIGYNDLEGVMIKIKEAATIGLRSIKITPPITDNLRTTLANLHYQMPPTAEENTLISWH